MMSREIELKLALAEPVDLPRLLAALPAPDAVVEQVNHYFRDPGGRLAAAHVMVRIRESSATGDERPARVLLTVKRRASAEAGVFVSREDEMVLPHAAWEQARSGGAALVALGSPVLGPLAAELGFRTLEPVGLMRNLRRTVRLGDYVLEVDRTELPGGRVDAEVEVETDDPEGARAALKAVAAHAAVALEPQTSSKYARFLALT